jgi:hypothetical protein
MYRLICMRFVFDKFHTQNSANATPWMEMIKRTVIGKLEFDTFLTVKC